MTTSTSNFTLKFKNIPKSYAASEDVCKDFERIINNYLVNLK